MFKKKGYRIAALFLVALVLFSFSGCVGENNASPLVLEKEMAAVTAAQGEREAVSLFYVTKQGGYLIPISCFLCETEDPIRLTLERLITGSLAGEGLISPIPVETRVRDLYIRDGIAYVDLNSSFVSNLPIRGRRPQLAVDALVLTLTQFPEVDQVQILVDGQVLEYLSDDVFIGTPLEGPSWVNPLAPEPGEAVVVLYFDYQGDYFVPVTRSVADFSESLSRQVVRELIRGPEGLEGLNPVIPENVELRSYRVEEGTAYVDLSIEPEVLEDETWDEGRALGALVYSLTAFPHIERVQLLVEGRIVGTIGKGMIFANDQAPLPPVNLTD